MSSDIARGVIAKLRAENELLKKRNEVLSLKTKPQVYLIDLKKHNEPKRHAKNRRRA